MPQSLNRALSDRPALRSSLGTLVLVAVWFGIVTGLIEGVGLLLFQRINSERWGPMLHVSEQIIWISPLVDVFLFSLLVLCIDAAARLVPRLPAIRVTVVVLATLTAYDWLTLTGRLRHRSCLLLAIGLGAAFSRWFGKHEAAALRFWKRSLPGMAVAVMLALMGIQGGRWLTERRELAQLPPFPPDSPNVLVIVVDTLRADHLSSYGYARPTSPNIDRMAKQGVLFENAFSTSSWSFPSHVSLLTGRYQFQHGLESVPPMQMFGAAANLGSFPTLAETWERRGYRTGAFSANRIYFSRDLGFGRGFTHFEDYFHSPADMFVRTLYGRELARAVLLRNDESKLKHFLAWLLPWSWFDRDAEGSGNLAGGFGLRKRANVVNQEVLRWIDRDTQRPFFAFLNYFDVHSPYRTPPSYPTPAWDHGELVDRYDNGVKYVDDSIGELMAELGKRGLDDKTLVVITSDHGESLGQHSLPSHGTSLYRAEIQVPLIFWYPGHLPPGVRLATPVTNAAIPATLVDVLGAKEASRFPGPPLSVLWKTPQGLTSWPDTLSELTQRKHFANDDRPGEDQVPTGYAGPMKSLVTAQWHLIIHKNLGDQLYGWVHDPRESNNLIQTMAGREIARSLISRMEDMLAGSVAGPSQKAVVIPLHHDGSKASGDLVRAAQGATPVNDYYRFETEAGSTVTVEVKVQAIEPVSRLDPVIAIEGPNSGPLLTCRNPGDDHTQAPGVADPTPDAFDDICVNDDVHPGVNADSRLEILVPDSSGPVELRVRVSDWNGQARSAVHYQISVTGARPASPLVKAEVR